MYKTEVDPLSQERCAYVNVCGVWVKTYASKEEVEEIFSSIIFSNTDVDMLRTIAICYNLRQPLMFEGDPGCGKTFLIKKFVQLIHGKDAPILELMGTPRTSELEILGHWSPRAVAKDSQDPTARDTWQRYEEISARFKKENDAFDTTYEDLKEQYDKGSLEEGDFSQKLEELRKRHSPLRDRYTAELQMLMARSSDKVEWEFQEGALLQAYAGREGKGFILIGDEINLIPSNYQQIFLSIGGEKGALSESVSFWGGTSKTTYERGIDTWFCFAGNFPEKTPGRGEVVAPLTDRLVWKVITSNESEDKKSAIRKTAGGRLGKRSRAYQYAGRAHEEFLKHPIPWDKALEEALGEQVADTMDHLDDHFCQHYANVGDYIKKGSDNTQRMQKMEFSGRNPLRVFSYLDLYQVEHRDHPGIPDFTKTLERAYHMYYLDRIADEDGRRSMKDLFEEFMTGTTGNVVFDGGTLPRKEVFEALAERAYNDSLSEEQKRAIAEAEEANKREEEKRKQKQKTFDFQDRLDSLRSNINLPEETRRNIRRG